jgi:arginine deiminase
VNERAAAAIPYGCEDFGRLTTVMVHRPGIELEIIDHDNCGAWLFERVPDIQRFVEEHDRYRALLESHGVEVLELTDYLDGHRELTSKMPNLTYLHDTAVICSTGAILSSMARKGRKREQVVVREALDNLGIPIFCEFDDEGDAFEGCLLLSRECVLVAETERHSKAAIEKFIRRALTVFDEVVYVDVPKARRYMHPDTIFNRVSTSLALAYLPAFKSAYSFTRRSVDRIDFAEHVRRKGVEVVDVSDSEQRRLACSFVPLEPGVILHYDTALDAHTQTLLARKGVDILFFHPEALTAGGGSLRCMTLRIHRAAS